MKEHFFSAVVRHRKTIIITFFPATIPSLFCGRRLMSTMTSTPTCQRNLPPTVSLGIMKEEFGREIVDYGNDKEVKVLNTTDEIRQQGDQITLSSDADKVYYEDILDRHDLPGDIQIRYTLNGETVTSENLGGSSGKLSIDLSFRQNPNYDSSFFDYFALQTTMPPGTNHCSKITAEGATIANVGENKQLSYIILPGKEKDFHITADVTDFAMDSININGIRMDLSVDIDNGDLLDEVSQIENAAISFDDGAAALTTVLPRFMMTPRN